MFEETPNVNNCIISIVLLDITYSGWISYLFVPLKMLPKAATLFSGFYYC